MSEHTPGPWWVTDHGVRDRGGYIAHMNSVQRYEGQDERYAFEVAQREADKRLIAAAPDLLAALKGVLPYMEAAESAGLVGDEGCHWPVENVRAAIAKAEAGKVGDEG